MENRIKGLTDMFDSVEHSNCAYLEFEDGSQMPHQEVACIGDTEIEARDKLYLYVAHALGNMLNLCKFDYNIGLVKTDSLKNYVFVWRIEPDYAYQDNTHAYYCRFSIYHKNLVKVDYQRRQ